MKNAFPKEWLVFKSTKWASLATAAMMVACSPSGEEREFGPVEVQQTPEVGASSFVSADGRNGQATQENDDNSRDSNNAAAPGEFDGAGGAGGEERTVEEGDIYRVQTDSGLILNLNAYRGFQIIDFSDPSSPEIVGKVRMSGTPVEMYTVGDRAYVMLNDWRSYWTSRHDPLPETHQGGGIIVIDISDTANPKVTARARIDGWIQSSRLTRGGGKEALYVVASEWNGGGVTNVKSFSVSDAGKLDEKTELSLGGSVQDIQATGDRLLVSRWEQGNWDTSRVSIIDISSPDGEMVQGDEIPVKGRVQNKFNMDLHEGVLRVVSGNSWGSSANTNHVETFDATDIQNVTPIDHATFGDNEDLYATLFMGEKAFFVTYRRVDPFHAFEITESGQITEKSEFIVSGWNDYFKPVVAQSRLIGIGKNDEQGSTMAVSLYDITDLTNPSPMITREEVDLEWSWSEAQWDDRAFSVLEKATNVVAADGVTQETGLVLLPFSGWDDAADKYVSAVQIYTFSDSTLTLRGTMEHGTPVRRSFVADATDNTTGNLSEAELSLFDTTDPDAPVELGRAELAPNYADFKVFGQYGVRHHERSDYYGWWGNSAANQTDSLQVVPLSGDVDAAAPVASLDVPAGSQTYQVGDRLVVARSVYTGYDEQSRRSLFDTTLEVYDLSDPTAPAQVGGTYTSSDLSFGGGYYGGYYDDCEGCGRGGYYGYGYGGETYAAGDFLVIPSQVGHDELEGQTLRQTWRVDYERNRWGQDCYGEDRQTGEWSPRACTYYDGYESCTQLTRVDGTVEGKVCQGQFAQCTQDAAGETTCNPIDREDAPTTYDEYTYEQRRYWSSYELQLVDVGALAAGQGGDLGAAVTTLSMPSEEEAAGLVAEGDSIFVSYKKPTTLPGDSRPYVRYFFKEVDLSGATPVSKPPVNVPGTLVEVDGDTLLTQDYLWGQTIVESSINKLELRGQQAFLRGTHRFVDQQVASITADGAGHAVVSHQTAWYANYASTGGNYQEYDHTTRMSVLDLAGTRLDVLSETEIDDWASLRDARAGSALFQVPGGLLVMSLADPSAPAASSYFATRGWPRDIIVEGQDVFFSAGRYGLYRFDLNEENLATE
jgi:hypothetical protein